MPEYLTPGVYIEEFEIGGKPIEGVSTSTTGFLGLTQRGPTSLVKAVVGFPEFVRYYGSYLDESYLAYAVEGFFANGGQRCFIGRIVRAGAVEAKVTLDSLNFKAVGEGSWGNRVAIRIKNSSNDPTNTAPA